jgi:hypothetical protein
VGADYSLCLLSNFQNSDGAMMGIPMADLISWNSLSPVTMQVAPASSAAAMT